MKGQRELKGNSMRIQSEFNQNSMKVRRELKGNSTRTQSGFNQDPMKAQRELKENSMRTQVEIHSTNRFLAHFDFSIRFYLEVN